MLKFIPNTTLIAIFVLTIIFVCELGIAAWAISEKGKTVASLTEMSERIDTLERSLTQEDITWE